MPAFVTITERQWAIEMALWFFDTSSGTCTDDVIDAANEFISYIYTGKGTDAET